MLNIQVPKFNKDLVFIGYKIVKVKNNMGFKRLQ